MSALRFCLSLAGIALFILCVLVLIFGAAAALGGQSFSPAANWAGGLFGALILVVMLRAAVIWLENRGRTG